MNIANESIVDTDSITTSKYDDTKDRLMQLSEEDKKRLMSEMSVTPSDTGITEDDTSTGTDVAVTPKGDQHIILDGPLGHIYTKALDMVYAKEGMVAATPPMGDVEIASDLDQGTYVYCCDAAEVGPVEASKAIEAFETAMNQGYRTLILSAEAHQTFIKGSISLGVLEEYVNEIGGRTYYRRATALERLRGIHYDS